MRKLHSAIALVALATASPVAATTVTDPTGDFISSFTGPHEADLDVTSFSVVFDPSTQIFAITGVLAGVLDPEHDFYYVTGVNTGAGAIAPFGSIGQPNVTFDRAVIFGSEGDGEAFIGGTPLNFAISGNSFQVWVPLSLLPSTGANPLDYGFNLWPRTDLVPSNLGAISDFAPNNALVQATAAVPEPGTWMLMLGGFAMMGGALRFRRRSGKGARLTIAQQA